MTDGLDGRVAIVTGAGSGIGRASAVSLAGAGAAVVCADLHLDAARAAAEDIGAAATAAQVDVSSRAAVDGLVATTLEQHGRLDVMCNIAGIMTNAPLVDLTEDDLDRVLATNLKGVLFGCQAAVRAMREHGGGSIVNMTSGAIDVPAPGVGAYAMSKAAVAQLTKTLAVEVGSHGIRVNAVAPGFVLTAMTARHFTGPDGAIDVQLREAVLAPMRARSPLGMVGEATDIASAVVFLAGDASRFMTGQILRPNGGVAMP
jgi:3-oxoacyl-[acyl-carrier protein] reductase